MTIRSVVLGEIRALAAPAAERGSEARSRAAQAALAAELSYQRRMLERIVRGEPLDQTLNALCRHVEGHFPGSRCTVLRLDRALGVLRHVASPTIPQRFVAAIDGMPVGEGMGVCGTAAARAEVVIASDVTSDVLTQPYVELAREFNIVSVWSFPLVRAGGEVLGTFAVYREVEHSPSKRELEFVAATGNLAALAVDRDRSERALQAAVNLDALTGLPNRVRFLELVGAELQTEHRRVSVTMVQIDRFERISRSIGEIAADRLLVDASERLRRVIGERVMLARFGADSFILMTPALRPAAVDQLTERVTATMSEPFQADGLELLLTTSIGIATSERASDAFGLVREAETAIQAARAGGPGHHQVYDHTLRTRELERLRTEAQLRRAIERDQLLMHYQPILNVSTRDWSGVEALVRWQHPERGLLGPDEFIPLAEDTGLIVPLGERVLELVCAQARRWRPLFPELSIGINASPAQLAHPGTAALITDTLAHAGLEPSTVTLEVTESALEEELETTRAALEELERAGVRVLIDDFGTGYSSLARLGELPISGLKIDRRFVRGLGHDPAVLPVVQAIANLARAYGLEVVVEGIEDAEALAVVEALRCEYAQGFHLGRPAAAAVVERLLAAPPAVPA